MTQNEIIEMARQAGIVHPEMVSFHLEAFAKLVAAKAIAELESQEPAGKLQEPTVERAWFTIAELNAWADKKLSENPHWVMPKEEPERDEPPPQRTWVGMTDDEIDKAWRSVDYTVPWEQHRIDIAQAIEAKLKKKNT